LSAQWQQIGGQARDIGIGANGTVWVIGWTAVPGGYNIGRWNGSYWENIPGGAVRIDVDPNGNAWIVNDRGEIFRWNGRSWDGIGGQGRDVGIGADGVVWLIGWNSIPGGYPVFRWNGSSWENIDGGLNNISGGQSGVAWGTNTEGLIWKRTNTSTGTRRMTRFDPAVHGFRFVNDFVSNFAGIDLKGLCGGMAYSALDYFNNNIPVPTQTNPPENGTVLRQYIYNRQQNSSFDNTDKWAELFVNPGNPFDGGRGFRNGEFFNWGLQGYGGGRVQELRAAIDANRPVTLGLFKGGNAGFANHHQVLAIGYDMGRYRGDLGQFKEDLRIYVYDSNFPGRTMCLRPNLSNQTYYYDEEPSCSWLTYFVDSKYRLASPPR
jgi:Tectonin domain